MKIRSAEIIQVEKWVEVSVTHNGKNIKFSVITIDGKVKGEMKNNFATSYLSYFHETPYELQEKHFNKVKEYIEKRFDLPI